MAEHFSDLLQRHSAGEAGWCRDVCWRPAVDIYRSPRYWLVKVELAGVRAEDVQVHFRGRWLTVGGVRRDWLIQEQHQAYLMEIAYHRFERTLELPCELGDARMSSEFRDGMLLIHLHAEGRP